ncbi:FAD/NAD(P)-binding protein [Lacticaseibacillus thailandensis]|uniref:FAD(NAD)-dependent oxidoreductase n=1 Tax=Lacticaseibacillus thailandensis DSM 22698 = JCM 13996 TaxID=1423810 RepID=A0A0R2C7P8_9LACO|nr:FAD/NAD(P)-binding protein [Lacticaseibacillus thailandensis]KRM87253.1 FAD(NAD)-dependent oxidoreductase [Lacticaseibacillus thailandensis DSM 22698 = JCM 13996]
MEIAIIGAGSRGLVATQRLVAWARQTTHWSQLRITLIDPYGVGGRVWRQDQSHLLLMNTNPANVTLFADAVDHIAGPIVPGPDLYTWTQTLAADFIRQVAPPHTDELLAEVAALAPNGFASRQLFALYAAWFYTQIQAKLPAGVTLRVLTAEAQGVRPQDGRYTITLPTQQLLVDKVVMALGHYANDATPEQADLAQQAALYGLTYVLPTEPQEYDFSQLQPQQTVILRGLGLNFFDAVTLLTQGRGGRFTRGTDGWLTYRPSGQEPQIVAGSRRGFPLRAKGVNMTDDTQFHGQFINPEWVAQFTEPGTMSGQELLSRVRREMAYAYYRVLLRTQYPQVDADALLAKWVQSPDPDAVIAQTPVRAHDVFDPDALLHPERQYPHSDRREVMAAYLTADVQLARRGTKDGPDAAALEVLRDVRNDLRIIVARRLLSETDYYQELLGRFKRAEAYLAVGPPDTRIEELRALVLAGVVTILGPAMAVTVDPAHHQFRAWSQTYSHQQYYADWLVEARLPAVNAETTQNPLVRSLLQQHLARPQRLTVANARQVTGAVDVDPLRATLLPGRDDSDGLFFWGVPTEGATWFTTTTPHPGLPDSVISTADCIAAQIFAG